MQDDARARRLQRRRDTAFDLAALRKSPRDHRRIQHRTGTQRGKHRRRLADRIAREPGLGVGRVGVGRGEVDAAARRGEDARAPSVFVDDDVRELLRDDVREMRERVKCVLFSRAAS